MSSYPIHKCFTVDVATTTTNTITNTINTTNTTNTNTINTTNTTTTTNTTNTTTNTTTIITTTLKRTTSFRLEIKEEWLPGSYNLPVGVKPGDIR